MQHFSPKKNLHLLVMSARMQPQQPSTSKPNASKLKEKLKKNKCPFKVIQQLSKTKSSIGEVPTKRIIINYN
jgi:hypothetical protein